MTGQRYDVTSGVRLLTRGQARRRRTTSPMGGTTVLDLLAVPVEAVPDGPGVRPPVVGPPTDVEVLDPSWLLDLHDPTLVITDSYVGPDRRRRERTSVQGGGTPGRWNVLLRRAAQVIVATTVAVVPLVLIATPAVPPATGGIPPTATKAGHVHRTAHAYGASRLRAVRAEATRLRAPGSAGARTAAPAPSATASAPAPAPAPTASGSARSAARAAGHARRVRARAAAQAQAARHRAHRAAARAAAQAQAARHRAHRAAARSQLGGRGTVPSAG